MHCSNTIYQYIKKCYIVKKILIWIADFQTLKWRKLCIWYKRIQLFQNIIWRSSIFLKLIHKGKRHLKFIFFSQKHIFSFFKFLIKNGSTAIEIILLYFWSAWKNSFQHCAIYFYLTVKFDYENVLYFICLSSSISQYIPFLSRSLETKYIFNF